MTYTDDASGIGPGPENRSDPERGVLAAFQEKISSLERQLEMANGRVDEISTAMDRIIFVSNDLQKRVEEIEMTNQERDRRNQNAITDFSTNLSAVKAQIGTTITDRDAAINTLIETGAGSRRDPVQEILAALKDENAFLKRALEQVNRKVDKFDSVAGALMQADELAGARITRAEKANRELEGKCSTTIEAFKEEVKGIASQVLTVIANRDETINALTQTVLKFNAPNHPI